MNDVRNYSYDTRLPPYAMHIHLRVCLQMDQAKYQYGLSRAIHKEMYSIFMEDDNDNRHQY